MTVSTLAPRARRRMTPPPPPDAVTQYALDVTAGRIVAGSLVRRACERHLSDLANGHERGLRFDREAAEHAIAFFPLLRHYKGDWGPKPGKPAAPIVLEPWQKFIVGAAFGWKRADGTRRFRKVYVEVAKKNGKTLIAAGVGILLAFFDNEPGAEVYAVATKKDQAKLVWSDAVQMVRKNPGLARRIATTVSSIADLATASFFKPLGRDSDTGDQGINVHGAIVDELHVHADREQLDNVETATSSRSQPMVWIITTAGVRRESVWWEERTDAIAVVENRATDDSMLVLVYTLDEGDNPFDEAVWPKSNPNLGVSVRVDTLREQAEAAKRSPGKVAAFLRYRANVPTQQSTRWLRLEDWDDPECVANDAGLSYEDWVAERVPAGAVGYAGLDLASVRDLTAFLALFRDGEEVTLVARFWCPEEGVEERSKRDGVPYGDWVRDGYLIATPGNVTDYDRVEQDILALADEYEVAEIGFDRWNATALSTRLANAGAQMVAISQNYTGLSAASKEFEKLVVSHRVRHGGNPVLRWMVGNVEVETDASENIRPSKRRSSERIDGIVAAIMGLTRMMAQSGQEVEWTAA